MSQAIYRKDLPIEHLWMAMKRRVRNVKTKNLQELLKISEKRLGQYVCAHENFVHTRRTKVIKKRGRTTKYQM